MENQQVLEKEIDLIQACINRMAQNSFAVKGWLISVVAVVLALLPEKVNYQILSVIVFATTLCFWYLDAYYLRMERLFRWKYEWVIKNRLENNEFFYDMNPTNKAMWNCGPDGKSKQPPSVIRVMFSKSLVPIYTIIILMSLICFMFAT